MSFGFLATSAVQSSAGKHRGVNKSGVVLSSSRSSYSQHRGSRNRAAVGRSHSNFAKQRGSVRRGGIRNRSVSRGVVHNRGVVRSYSRKHKVNRNRSGVYYSNRKLRPRKGHKRIYVNQRSTGHNDRARHSYQEPEIILYDENFIRNGNRITNRRAIRDRRHHRKNYRNNHDYSYNVITVVPGRAASECPSGHNCGYRLYEDGTGPRIIVPQFNSEDLPAQDGVRGPKIIRVQ